MDYPRRPLWSYSYTAAPWIDHVPRALQQEPVSHNPESSTTMAGSDTLDAEENAGWNSPLGNPVSHYVPYDYAPPPAVQNNGENHVFLNFASAGTNGHEPARFPSASMFHPSTYLQSSVGAASEQQAGWTSGATSHGNYWSPNALDQLMGPTGDAGFGYDRASSLPVQGLFDVPSDHPTPPHLGIRNVLTNTSFVGSPGVVYGAVNGTPFPVSPLAAAPVGPPVAGPSTSLARRPESDRAATGSRPGGDYSTFDPSMSAPTVSTAPFSSFSIPNDLSSTITTPPISGTLLPLAVHPVQCSTMASMERNAVPYDHGTVQVRLFILYSGERLSNASTFTGDFPTGLREVEAGAAMDYLWTQPRSAQRCPGGSLRRFGSTCVSWRQDGSEDELPLLSALQCP